MSSSSTRFKLITLTLSSLMLIGCSSTYYKGMDSVFGIHKRDILVHRVEKARDSQQEAKEQFKSALEQFTAMTNFQGGELQDKYEKLQAEFDESEESANDIRFRIKEVENVSEALFEEWQEELEQYSKASLRRNSERKLQETKRRYGQLITAMKRAEGKMEPVLSAFRDQVLYLKHNLNAQAIASLKSELDAVETDIGRLIKEMEKSIQEADSFIQSMES